MRVIEDEFRRFEADPVLNDVGPIFRFVSLKVNHYLYIQCSTIKKPRWPRMYREFKCRIGAGHNRQIRKRSFFWLPHWTHFEVSRRKSPPRSKRFKSFCNRII